MIATIDRKATGVHLRRLMDKNDISVKQLQKELNLSSVQSVYHWLNGITLPTLDNLYSMSVLFGVAMDDMICGSAGNHFRRRPFTVPIEIFLADSRCIDYSFEI